MSLACLERLVETAPLGAQPGLRERTYRLTVLRDALESMNASAADRGLHAAFAPDAPLADYLRGIYAWVHATTRALDDLTTRLSQRKPDWAVFRWRIEEAKNFHFDDLRPRIRANLDALAGPEDGSVGPALLRDAAERIFLASDGLEETLDRRFS
jgi:hypothetical protein